VPFDSADRPRAPLHEDAAVTPYGRVAQRTLRGIHDHLRAEMSCRRFGQRRPTRGAADARALVAGMTMGVSFRALGSFCGQELLPALGRLGLRV